MFQKLVGWTHEDRRQSACESGQSIRSSGCVAFTNEPRPHRVDRRHSGGRFASIEKFCRTLTLGVHPMDDPHPAMDLYNVLLRRGGQRGAIYAVGTLDGATAPSGFEERRGDNSVRGRIPIGQYRRLPGVLP